MFHCTAGKDRTGVLSALVLSLLGVDEPTVVADYALSGEAMLRLRAKLMSKYPEGRETLENIDEVFSADPAQMEPLLDHMQEHYGSVDAYVEGLGRSPRISSSACGRPCSNRRAKPPPPSSSRTSGRKRSTAPASARSSSVSPPESCVDRTRRTVFHRMSMSGWWFAASAAAPTALTKARAAAKSCSLTVVSQLVALAGPVQLLLLERGVDLGLR